MARGPCNSALAIPRATTSGGRAAPTRPPAGAPAPSLGNSLEVKARIPGNSPGEQVLGAALAGGSWALHKKRAHPKLGEPWWLIGEIVTYNYVHLRHLNTLVLHLATFDTVYDTMRCFGRTRHRLMAAIRPQPGSCRCPGASPRKISETSAIQFETTPSIFPFEPPQKSWLSEPNMFHKPDSSRLEDFSVRMCCLKST